MEQNEKIYVVKFLDTGHVVKVRTEEEIEGAILREAEAEDNWQLICDLVESTPDRDVYLAW